jgi:hypothetical protein
VSVEFVTVALPELVESVPFPLFTIDTLPSPSPAGITAERFELASVDKVPLDTASPVFMLAPPTPPLESWPPDKLVPPKTEAFEPEPGVGEAF